ncbi:MAG: glycosyltransferase family 4 protein [Chloroflexi bacterium]|nr:glycosyltransferase family 4 protein [Chloroflexota bacterium]
MRIAVYDAWLHTLGGGEKHMLEAALALSERHEVHVHTHRHVTRKTLETATGLPLGALQICIEPNTPARDFSGRFRDYDFFINSTHDSLLPNPCMRGVRLLFFPPPRPNRFLTAAARAAGAAARILGCPQYSEGFYGPERVGRGWYRNTGRAAEITIAGSRNAQFRFMAGNASEKPKIATLFVGGQEVYRATVPSTRGDFTPVGPIEVPSSNRRSSVVEVRVSGATVALDPQNSEDREIGIAVADPNTGSVRELPHRLLTQRLFPRLGEGIERLNSAGGRDALASYDRIVANSHFTGEWLRRWWDLPCNVIHPPVEAIYPPSSFPRKNVTPYPDTGRESTLNTGYRKPEILSVGRFFVGGHGKNHRMMIETFAQMVRHDGLTGWTLRLIGASGSTPADRDYLSELRSLIGGLPVKIESDVDVNRIREAYRRASVYWHAAGFGQNEKRHPESFEHFGIAPVEAMSAGAVPVVFDGGGVRETVEDGKSGYLWRSPSQLRQISWRLIRDASLRNRLAAAATERSREFSSETFRKAFTDLVEGLLS